MILTQDQLTLENSLRRILPAGVVSCWIPNGYGGAKDVIGGNHGRCFGTHPNVPVLPNLADPSVGWWFGGDDWIDCGTGITINPGDDFSFGVWTRIDDLDADWQPILGHGPTNHGLYAIHNRKPFYYFGSFFYGDTWTTTGWHYLAITKKGNVHQLYQDGIPTTSYTEAEAKTLSQIYIGALLPVYYLTGYAVLPFVSNKAQSQQEVENFMLNTKSLFSPRRF